MFEFDEDRYVENLRENLEYAPHITYIECDYCGEVIYEYDDYYLVDGAKICEDCIEDCKTSYSA